jgi:hypothetical protein
MTMSVSKLTAEDRAKLNDILFAGDFKKVNTEEAEWALLVCDGTTTRTSRYCELRLLGAQVPHLKRVRLTIIQKEAEALIDFLADSLMKQYSDVYDTLLKQVSSVFVTPPKNKHRGRRGNGK